jgi:D-3-phosphoglycerate dehydrogenase / 2-oxoglutarate reductase
MNTPGGNSASAAELTVSLIMAMSRQIPEASNSLKEGRWDRKKFMGTELNGKTIGIVGLGAIGRRVAKTCQALDMKVLGYDPLLSRALAEKSGITPVTLNELFAESDLISLHTPLNSDTRHLLNKESFAKCKEGVRIVNCARGGIVDEDDLLEALNSGRVAAAALDVYESEPPKENSKALLVHPNLICTPHLGANTGEAQAKVAVDIAHQFVDAFEGRQVVGVVNSRILSELAARKELHSYIELAERIGSLQAQLIQGRLKRVELRTRGDELKESSALLKAAALKGILSQLVEESVNYINAPGLANDFGLEVIEVHENRPSVHGTSLTITFETENGDRKLVGTVLQGNKPRVVQVDDFNLELAPEGELLFFKNDDKPGFLSNVTGMIFVPVRCVGVGVGVSCVRVCVCVCMCLLLWLLFLSLLYLVSHCCSLSLFLLLSLVGILGKNNINISTLAIGRQNVGGVAVGCLGLDSRLDDRISGELKDMEDLQWIHPASLPPLGDHGTILQDMKVDDTKPVARPQDPNFSSGPCKKR